MKGKKRMLYDNDDVDDVDDDDYDDNGFIDGKCQ